MKSSDPGIMLAFISKQKVFVLSVFLLYPIICGVARENFLPTDYQRKLLVPEPILVQDNFPELSDTSQISQIILSVYTGDSLFLSGDLIKALQIYSEGFELAQGSDNTWFNILLSNRLGYTNYWSLNFQEASECYQRSLELVKREEEIMDTLLVMESIVYFRECNEIPPMIDGDLIQTLFNDYLNMDSIGNNPTRNVKFHLLEALWHHEEMNFHFEKQELQKAEKQLFRGNQNQQLWLFLIRLSQMNYYSHIKEHELVADFLSELSTQVTEDVKFHTFRYFVLYFQCQVSSFKKNYKKAKEFADRLATYIGNKKHPYFYYDYILLGWIYHKSGNKEEALNCYHNAKEILDINNIKDERLALIYWYLAYFYQRALSDEEMSLQYLRRAETVLIEHPDFHLETYVYADLGNYYYRKKDFDLAIMTFNIILNDLDQLLTDETYFKTRYPYLQHSSYFYNLEKRAKAFYYLSKGNNYDLVPLKSSYRDYKDLLTLQQKIFEETDYEDSKIAVLEELRRISNSLLNVGYTLFAESGNDSLPDELYEIMEGSKAYMFKRYCSDDLAKRMAGIPEELIIESKNLRKELDTLQYSFRSTDMNLGKRRENLLVTRILDKQAEYRKFIQNLELEYPKYAELKNQSGTISMKDIQNKLHTSQAFIDYHYNHNSLYLFYIDKDTIKIVYQPIDKTFPDRIREYRKTFENVKFGDFDSETLMSFARQSHQLYQFVLQPIKKDIEGKRLIIVPDREFNFIPFESLVTSEVDNTQRIINYSELDYLVYHNPVSYLYSASQLLEAYNTPRRKVRFAGFAPDYSKLQDGEKNVNNIYMQLSELPGAYDEVLSATKYFKGKCYTGENIVKDQFFKANLGNDIIHLAMHTILDSDEPMNSELVLSTNPGNGACQLRAYEVYSKRNSASLVVLSACNTGVGKLSGGEGVFNIARAFLLAGIHNVVLTQWPVADRSSATLMDSYYRYLSEGYATDIALQKSKIDFLKFGDPVKAHPYYWTAYVNIGNPFSFPKKNNFLNLWWAILIPVTIGALLFIFRMKLKHS